jgi:hypothetical protein
MDQRSEVAVESNWKMRIELDPGEAHLAKRWRASPPAQQIALGSATDAAGCVVAGGFTGQASAANHKLTLEPRFVVLIGGLLLFPAAFWLKLAIWFSRRSVDWADNDFSLRARRFC